MDAWQGPVFLPTKRSEEPGHGRFFFARVRGNTRVHPFLPAEDQVSIVPSSDTAFLQLLVDSHFGAKEWLVRENAEHAKSKTYKRVDAISLLASASVK
jgi:hypothetical protein